MNRRMLKKWIYIVIATTLLSGCEIIREDERLLPVSIATDTTGRAHVLIEFTGFRCVNCPNAAAVAESLHETYGEQMIVVAMHPASNPFTQGSYDYTCDAADYYYTSMRGNATTPFPTGNIDMLDSQDGYLHDYPEWAALVAAQMKEPEHVFLNVEAERAKTTDELTIRTTYYANEPQQCGLTIWLVEDSIQGAQALPDGSVDFQYYHRHVLRTAIGDPQGRPIQVNLQTTTTTTSYTLPEAYNAKRCSIIAIITDKDNKIINARQIRIQ